MKLPKKSVKETVPVPTPSTNAVWTDSHNIVYIDGGAEISVNVSVKLSKHYQSAGLEAGIRFRTPVQTLDETLPRAVQKVKQALHEEVRKISEELDNFK